MPKIRNSYQLHVQLCDIKPMIWRRLIVSDSMSLAQLHQLVQVAMGWPTRTDYLFELAGQRYGQPNPDWPEDPTMDARRYTLGQLFNGTALPLRYTYNLADEWVHRIKLESCVPTGSEQALQSLPLCTGGRNHCLPGIHADCQEAPEHAPFDLTAVQQRIRALPWVTSASHARRSNLLACAQ